MKRWRQHKRAAIARASSYGKGAAFFILCGLYAGPGQAQNVAAPQKDSLATADAAEAASAAKDEILVTAHRHGAVATHVPPEVSLNAVAIQSLGAADLTEVIRELPPESGGDVATSNNAATSGNSAIVLVNGQRIAGFASIKDFPPEAVRRIEIFPEKVALQYGYGPDQRVVNIVLRTDYRALTVLGRYTLAPETWRGLYRAKVDLIRIGEDWHWNLALDYSHENAIHADTTLVGPPATADDSGTVRRHTLAAQTDHLTASGAMTRRIGQISVELAGSLALDALQSRPGLSDEDGDVLAQEGLSDLVSGSYRRIDRTVDAQTSLTMNGKLDSWRWSFTGKLDESTRITRSDGALGVGGLDVILLPSPSLLGDRCDNAADAGCVSTTQRMASGDFYLNGDLFSLPAGAVTAALRTGFAFSDIRSESALVPDALERNEGNVQANLDFPLASRDAILGKLSVGINGAARQLTDFGTLTTIGSTLDWSPIRPVNIQASVSRSQQAPTLLQLGEAMLVTPDLREYDFVTGTTAITRRIEGGNGDLVRSTSRTARVRLQVNPFPAADLALSAEYTLDHTRNPILSLSAATAATVAAFPDHFTTEKGYLTAIDVSPVNLARRDRQQIRWGLNYSTAFGAAWPARNGGPADPTKPVQHDQFQIALYDTWRLQDDVVLRDGLPTLDLLGHDILSDGGGTPTHRIELQTTVATRAVSADVSAGYQTPTNARAGTLSADELTFSQGITLNLRLQINLADQHWLTRAIPWLRGSLNLSADNVLGAHTHVHEAGGGVPLAYSESYLNPTGRTFRITLRKRFR